MTLTKLKKVILAFGIFYLIPTILHGQEADLIEYTFDDLPRIQSQEMRHVFVFLTADWCKYCKSVELTSFKNEVVIDQLNKNFYTIIFDIEERRDINLFGREFKYKSTGLNTGVHELAELIGAIDGVLNTPTFLIFDQSLQMIYQYSGFMKTEEILTLLDSVKRI
jgi:thioredoxin-related protein